MTTVIDFEQNYKKYKQKYIYLKYKTKYITNTDTGSNVVNYDKVYSELN